VTFGEKLAQARKRKGLTQKEVAAIIGIAKSTLTGYEKGTREPNLLRIKQLIKILDIDSDYLFGIDEKQGEYLELIDAYAKADERHRNIVCAALGIKFIG